MTWECHVDDLTKVGFYRVLDIELLTDMVLYFKLSEHVIIGGDITYEGCTAPVVDMSTCNDY